MKHSVFWKIIIGLLVFTSLAECIMMFVLYNVTYNQAIEDATENIRYAASNCASTFEFYDPNDLSDYQDAREFLNNLCNGLDIQRSGHHLPVHIKRGLANQKRNLPCRRIRQKRLG